MPASMNSLSPIKSRAADSRGSRHGSGVARMTQRPRGATAILTCLLTSILLLLTACDATVLESAAPTACTEAGAQCQLPTGPLGVCERSQCPTGAVGPCYDCISQH